MGKKEKRVFQSEWWGKGNNNQNLIIIIPMKKTQSDYGCLFEPVVAHCLLYKTPPLETPTTIQKSMTVC